MKNDGALTVARALVQQISTRIQQARKARGLTQAQLANEVGIDPATVSRYESGRLVPDVAVLVNICEALGLVLTRLVDLSAVEAVHLMRSTAGRLEYSAEQAQLIEVWSQLPPRDRKMVIDACLYLRREKDARKMRRTGSEPAAHPASDRGRKSRR